MQHRVESAKCHLPRTDRWTTRLLSLTRMLHRGCRWPLPHETHLLLHIRVAVPRAGGTTSSATPLRRHPLTKDAASSFSSRPCLCGDVAAGPAVTSPGQILAGPRQPPPDGGAASPVVEAKGKLTMVGSARSRGRPQERAGAPRQGSIGAGGARSSVMGTGVPDLPVRERITHFGWSGTHQSIFRSKDSNSCNLSTTTPRLSTVSQSS
jgi:hypothetical protein